MYVCMWLASVLARQSLLCKYDGLELAIAKPSEPGVRQDCVFIYEVWVLGNNCSSRFWGFRAN